jgi:hypothetical protein
MFSINPRRKEKIMNEEIKRRIAGVRRSSESFRDKYNSANYNDFYSDNTEETSPEEKTSATTAIMDTPESEINSESKLDNNTKEESNSEDYTTLSDYNKTASTKENTSNEVKLDLDVLRKIFVTNIITTEEERRMITYVREQGLEPYYKKKLLMYSNDELDDRIDFDRIILKDSNKKTATSINFSDLNKMKSSQRQKKEILKDMENERGGYVKKTYKRRDTIENDLTGSTKSIIMERYNKNMPMGMAKRSPDADKVKFWQEWSMTPHTEDEIREQILTDLNSVCFTYVCRYSKMSSKFIEEFIALSTGFLNKENYEKYKDAVLEAIQIKMGILDKPMEEVKLPVIETTDVHGEKRLIPVGDTLRDRVDWYYIEHFQNLEDWFKEKYITVLRKVPVVSEQQIIQEMTESAESMDEIEDVDESAESSDQSNTETSTTSATKSKLKAKATPKPTAKAKVKAPKITAKTTKDAIKAAEQAEEQADQSAQTSDEEKEIIKTDNRYAKETLYKAHTAHAGKKAQVIKAKSSKKSELAKEPEIESDTNKLSSELNSESSIEKEPEIEKLPEPKKESDPVEAFEKFKNSKSEKESSSTSNSTSGSKKSKSQKATQKKSIIIVNGSKEAKAMTAEQIDKMGTTKKKNKKH